MSFLKQLVKKLASGSNNSEPITHADEVEIDQALDTLMFRIDKPLRRLSMLLQGLPNPLHEDTNVRPTVHGRLVKWCEGKELGWLFDNATDSLDLASHRLYGFDVTEFLEDPETRVPTIMYLIFRSESMIVTINKFSPVVLKKIPPLYQNKKINNYLSFCYLSFSIQKI
jgi:type IV secretion system protein VirB4